MYLFLPLSVLSDFDNQWMNVLPNPEEKCFLSFPLHRITPFSEHFMLFLAHSCLHFPPLQPSLLHPQRFCFLCVCRRGYIDWCAFKKNPKLTPNYPPKPNTKKLSSMPLSWILTSHPFLLLSVSCTGMETPRRQKIYFCFLFLRGTQLLINAFILHACYQPFFPAFPQHLLISIT